MDPTATVDEKQQTPLEIAASRNSSEVFKIMSEHMDMSNILKLDLLAKLMFDDKVEDFKEVLCSLPLDLVGETCLLFYDLSSLGEHHCNEQLQ